MRSSTLWFSAVVVLSATACSVGQADLIPLGDSKADTMTGAGGGGASTFDGGPRGAAGEPADASDGGTTMVDAGVSGCSAMTCQANARCVSGPARCECLPGFVVNGGACVANLPGNPALHTKAEVCQAWQAAHVENAANGGFSVSTATCDPGTVSRDGLDDALRRLNTFRWLAGLGPTTEDPGNDTRAQGCALVSAWNPAGPSAHFPSSSATCFTAGGASGAGSSNIAWGSGTAANAMDQWFEDWGNDTTYGHRRWLLNPPLSDVGIGLYRGGNNYGSASCITVFGMSGSGPSPAWVAWPAPGYVPSDLMHTQWTVQGNVPGGATVTVTRQSDGQTLDTSVEWLQGSYGNSSALKLTRNGWSPVAGETYHVTIVGGASGASAIEYDLTPTQC